MKIIACVFILRKEERGKGVRDTFKDGRGKDVGDLFLEGEQHLERISVANSKYWDIWDIFGH